MSGHSNQREQGCADYGDGLFAADWFRDVFPHFDENQKAGAEVLVDRILARCGQDPDLPYVEHLIYFGCGNGSMLGHLSQAWADNERCKDRKFQARAFDASTRCVKDAAALLGNAVAVTECDSLDRVLAAIPEEELKRCALLILGHTWFHLDQAKAIEALRRYRPALVLIDVHQKWDHALDHLPYTEGYSASTTKDGVEAGNTSYLLKTQAEGKDLVRRGICNGDKELFHTIQALVTTRDLFGLGTEFKGHSNEDAKNCLQEARSAGSLAGGADFVCRRKVSHESGWGPMDCYCLVPRDPVAGLFNNAYSEVLDGLLKDVSTDAGADPRQDARLKGILRIFDEPSLGNEASCGVSGCRIAVGILPFDPNLTFCRFFPLFDSLSREICQTELLAEIPSLVQERFPSAYGVYQTLLSRSSCPQAFTLRWATDYDHTAVDRAFEKLEEEAIGIAALKKFQSKKGMVLIDDKNPPSFFMVPIYCGSLPLFALALRFPAFFDPARTGFDVFLSTLTSLHDAIKVFLTPEKIRLGLIRPWIERCLLADWSQIGPSSGAAEKLALMERHLFGKPVEAAQEVSRVPSYRLGEQWRGGGVLSQEWKSWILGLPSLPINRMARVEEENRRLWEIWDQERENALLDPALRISLWFQDGKFFEDVPGGDRTHEAFYCGHHMDRLREMFRILRYPGDMKSGVEDSWLDDAVRFLDDRREPVIQYFGKQTVDHFLFAWLCEQLAEVRSLRSKCAVGAECTDVTPQDCKRTKGPFRKLKALFCKTRANRGKAVRFTSLRLFWLLQAACKGALILLKDNDEEPVEFPTSRAFFSDSDPSMHLAELGWCLNKQGLLSGVEIDWQFGAGSAKSCTFTVSFNVAEEISSKSGGNECEEAAACLRAFKQVLYWQTTAPESLEGTKRLRFTFVVNKETQTIQLPVT